MKAPKGTHGAERVSAGLPRGHARLANTPGCYSGGCLPRHWHLQTELGVCGDHRPRGGFALLQPQWESGHSRPSVYVGHEAIAGLGEDEAEAVGCRAVRGPCGGILHFWGFGEPAQSVQV